jgi:hypothetical protein
MDMRHSHRWKSTITHQKMPTAHVIAVIMDGGIGAVAQDLPEVTRKGY